MENSNLDMARKRNRKEMKTQYITLEERTRKRITRHTRKLMSRRGDTHEPQDGRGHEARRKRTAASISASKASKASKSPTSMLNILRCPGRPAVGFANVVRGPGKTVKGQGKAVKRQAKGPPRYAAKVSSHRVDAAKCGLVSPPPPAGSSASASSTRGDAAANSA